MGQPDSLREGVCSKGRLVEKKRLGEEGASLKAEKIMPFTRTLTESGTCPSSHGAAANLTRRRRIRARKSYFV